MRLGRKMPRNGTPDAGAWARPEARRGQTLRRNGRKQGNPRQRAFTLAEVLVAVGVLGVMIVALYAGFSSGFAVVRVARENLRATQIMMQKTEAVRLYKWSQVTNAAFFKPSFTDWFDPSGTNTQSSGATYQGFIDLRVPAGVPSAYKNSMRSVTITVYWTNYPSWPQTNLIVRGRQMQTYVARWGMQNYVFQ